MPAPITDVIFVDVDGPMIPQRAAYLPFQSKRYDAFDPCASSLLLRLIEDAQEADRVIKIVVSSTWRKLGRAACDQLFEQNGIDPSHFHDDWATPTKMSATRTDEILLWLRDHPEVTTWVALDDEHLSWEHLPNAIQCDLYDGFTWRNYIECRLLLNLDDPSAPLNQPYNREKLASQVDFFKRREITRTKRRSEPGYYQLSQFAEQVFPIVRPAQDKDEQ